MITTRPPAAELIYGKGATPDTVLSIFAELSRTASPSSMTCFAFAGRSFVKYFDESREIRDTGLDACQGGFVAMDNGYDNEKGSGNRYLGSKPVEAPLQVLCFATVSVKCSDRCDHVTPHV